MTDVEQSMRDLRDFTVTALSLAVLTSPVWGPVAFVAWNNSMRPPVTVKAKPVEAAPVFYGSARAPKSVDERILDELESINSKLLIR